MDDYLRMYETTDAHNYYLSNSSYMCLGVNENDEYDDLTPSTNAADE